MVTPSARREMATKAVTHYAISIRLACRIFKVSESCYRYQPVLVDENQEIADWLLRMVIPPFLGAFKSRGHAACARRCFGV